MKKSILIKVVVLLSVLTMLNISSVGISTVEEKINEKNDNPLEENSFDMPSCGQVRIKSLCGVRARFFPAYGGGLGKYLNPDDFKGLYFGCDLRIYEGSFIEIRSLEDSLRGEDYIKYWGPMYIGLNIFRGEVHQDYDWGKNNPLIHNLGKIYEMSGYYFGTLIKP